ncbi:MAG: 50S ribosomal protein L5 [Candidatus Portnoybacteria bacterium]|nr:50S ribosomal protein L5 [Candidatus Portnoybacteria bacterium]
MIHLKKNYEEKTIPHFLNERGYKNRLAIPRIRKVTLNTGIGSLMKSDSNPKELTGEAPLKRGEARKVGPEKLVPLETLKQEVALVTGQKPVETKSKKSVAGFGTRKGQTLGVKVTLRGKKMIDFLEHLLNFALPRTRDFAGIPLTSFDEKGNLTIGIKEHTVFPEVGTGEYGQKVKKIFGFEVTITTDARSREEGIALLTTLGFPLERK